MEIFVDATRRTYQNAQALRAFWKVAHQARSRGGRLQLLRRMVALELGPDPYVEHDTPRVRRHFERAKSAGRFRVKERCWVCGEGAEHRHHIIKLSAGGRNRALNLVSLCGACHRNVHRAATRFPLASSL